MIETITPAVCGSRNRYRLALALFTLAALAAAALVGGLLGLLGWALGLRSAVLVAAGLAALAAAREVGVLRLQHPQLRVQVPERWHLTLPLPLWAAGYGAGLGVGFATYQPVATFWVACAAAVALARPLPAAACFSLYGLGRALMVVLPRREPDATATVEALARRRPLLVRANALALGGCAVALALAPSAASAPLPLGPGSELDPSSSRGVLAYTKRRDDRSSVVVRVSPAESYSYRGRSPSLNGDVLAYADSRGVRLVRWRSGEEIARIRGAASRPALDWPLVVYRRDYDDGTKRLVLRNLETGTRRRLAAAGVKADIGRPAIGGGRIAVHVAGPRGSRIAVYSLATRRWRVVARTRIALLAYPSLTKTRVAWIEQRSGSAYVRLRRFGRAGTRILATSRRRDRLFWTTALAGRSAYFTRWNTDTQGAAIYRARF